MKKQLILVLSLCGYLSVSAQSTREQISLSGTWKFRLLSPEKTAWQDIAVPGHWELQGFYPPRWRQPDSVAAEYRTELEIPARWKGRRIFLNFGGVYYRSRVLVDGQLLGEHESGYTAFTYEITDKVHAGKSVKLTVEVSTFGKYIDFDCLDFWALSGIYREVTLESRSRTFIDFWNYTTHWKDSLAELNIIGSVDNMADGQLTLDLSLLGNPMANQRVPVREGKFEATLVVKNPVGWTAETPERYDLELQILKDKGVVDRIQKKIGLREVRVEGPKLLINGRPIRMFGVCRHDLWPEVGRAVDRAVAVRDITLMKKTGINTVRTAHHPPERHLLEVADSLGMYILDNIPMSNISNVIDDTSYSEGVAVRTKGTILRDLHHPSVVAWAIGNENPMGELNRVMWNEIRKWDVSRPTFAPGIHRGERDFAEMFSKHYTSANAAVHHMSAVPFKPFITTEYQHSAYHGMGGFAGMWEALDASPSGTGGTIWEWFNQGIMHDFVEDGSRSCWPEVVTITTTQELSEIPSGFKPGKSLLPHTLQMKWRGGRETYFLDLGVMPGREEEEIYIDCDGIFVGKYHPSDSIRSLSFPFETFFEGEHVISMRIMGESSHGHEFDYFRLRKGADQPVWQYGIEDGASNEFARCPTNEKLPAKRLDAVHSLGRDGMLSAYREPEDDYRHISAIYAPVKVVQRSIDLINRRWEVELENRYNFTDLKQAETEYLLQFYNGSDIRTEVVGGPLVDLAAGECKRMILDLSFLGDSQLSAFEWRIRGTDPLEPDVLGRIDYNLSDAAPRQTDSVLPLTISLNGSRISITGGDTEYVFDTLAGTLVQIFHRGDRLLADQLDLSIWKPIEGHEQLFFSRRRPGYFDMNQTRLDDEFMRNPLSWYLTERPGAVEITFNNRYNLAAKGGAILTGFESYVIQSNRHMKVTGTWAWLGDTRSVPRFGFDFLLSSTFDSLTWSGYGPIASFSDGFAGASDRVHRLSRSNPDIETNKTGVRWLLWEGKQTSLLMNPGWSADIQASALEGATVQRVSIARGTGNKYLYPAPPHQNLMQKGAVLKLELEMSVEP